MATRCGALALVPLLSTACSSLAPDRAASWPEATHPVAATTRFEPAARPAAARSGGERSAFDESLGLRVGGLFASGFETEVSLSTDAGRGTSLRFEDELGLDDAADSLRVDLYWRINRWHRIDLGYFDLDRKGTRTASRQIEWGDYTFEVGSEITSSLRTRIFPLRYTYYFFAEEDFELGVGLGVYGMQVAAGLEGSATFGGATIPADVNAEFETPIPLPVAGIQGSYALGERWHVQASVQFFDVELENIAGTDRIDGYLVDALLGLDFRISNGLSVGAAANWFLMNAGADRDALSLDFDYTFAGGFVFLALRL
jgi:hypothetical protein